MKVAILLTGIRFGGPEQMPDARTATVSFDVASDFGEINLLVDVVPQDGDPDGLDGVVQIAQRSLVKFAEALLKAAKEYESPMIYSLKR